jgi:hypothetical protein
MTARRSQRAMAKSISQNTQFFFGVPFGVASTFLRSPNGGLGGHMFDDGLGQFIGNVQFLGQVVCREGREWHGHGPHHKNCYGLKDLFSHNDRHSLMFGRQFNRSIQSHL